MKISPKILLPVLNDIRLLAVALAASALLPQHLAFARQFDVLYSFCSEQNCADGSRPAAGLVMDENGALYGTTNIGGGSLPVDFKNGTIFKLIPPPTKQGKWTEVVLYRFCSLPQCIDGSAPSSRLLLHKGTLFGTVGGGTNRGGAAFKLTPSSVVGGPWTYTLLYSFCSLPNCADGSGPQGDLIIDHHGALYGVTQLGPGTDRGGTVFRLAPPAATDNNLWAQTVLHTFCSQSNCVDGDGPRAGLLMDHQGVLDGTTQSGGIQEGGVVFKLMPPSLTGGLWAENALYSFCSVTNCTDGAYPVARLIRGAHGAIFGATLNGGVSLVTVTGGSPSQGTVFKLTPPPANGNIWAEAVLHRFCSQPYCGDGSVPFTSLIMKHKALYGTTQSGGSDGRSGAIFKLTPPDKIENPWNETVLHSFCSLPNCADGSQPNTDMVMRDGALYGTTNSGGINNAGTVFKLDLAP